MWDTATVQPGSWQHWQGSRSSIRPGKSCVKETSAGTDWINPMDITELAQSHYVPTMVPPSSLLWRQGLALLPPIFPPLIPPHRSRIKNTDPVLYRQTGQPLLLSFPQTLLIICVAMDNRICSVVLSFFYLSMNSPYKIHFQNIPAFKNQMFVENLSNKQHT